MENKKRNRIVIALLIIIVVILSILCILLATETISFKSNEHNYHEPNNDITNDDDIQTDNNGDNKENNEDYENNNSVEVDKENDLSVYWLVNNDIIIKEETMDLSFKITNNGTIIINNNQQITNISNAKSIKLFSPPSPYSTLYILTKDGNLYKYETSEYEIGNYNATKLDKYSNVKEIITYQKRSTDHKGGCDYIFVADNNGKHYELDSFCI